MLKRREFLMAAFAAGMPLSPLATAVAQAAADLRKYVWCACVINCGQRCPLRCFIKDGKVIRIETDNILRDDNPNPRQIRACQRGRSMRDLLLSKDRSF